MKKNVLLVTAAFCFAAPIGVSPVWGASAELQIASDSIGGTVTSAKGPEAGVWVIAETRDKPTRFIKIVVTDDRGRYVLPQMPAAQFDIFVRGYGLVDSQRVKAKPGARLDLTATIAPDAKAAAEYYPANYWYAMVTLPKTSEFPGTGAKGNGIPANYATQQQWIADLREECGHCHQVGNKITRDIGDNSVEGWAERINQARPRGDHVLGNLGPQQTAGMKNVFAQLGNVRTLSMMTDWTKRIAAGETPKETPPRPSGVERNVVITMWDWANGRFVHDTSSTDRNNPTVNGGGPVYAGGTLSGSLQALDPRAHTQTETGYGVEFDKIGSKAEITAEHDISLFPHNTMLDSKGRVWAADGGRSGGTTPLASPEMCRDAANPYAKYYPTNYRSASVAVMLDPKSQKLSGIPLCYGVHHVMIAPDKDETVYFSRPGGDVVGWVNSRVYDQTRDAQKSQGWCPMVLDTNGDGKITPDRTAWNKAGKTGAPAAGSEAAGNTTVGEIDPKKDTQIGGGQYGIENSPIDASLWFAQNSGFPSAIGRFVIGANPPETCMTELYEPPKRPNGEYVAVGARGTSVDTKGVIWTMMSNGQMGSFDRGKCKVLNGPKATGQQCPEGWSFIDVPGPRIAGTEYQADWNYLTWVDRFDTLGLGKDVVMTPGTWSDSMIAVSPTTKKTTFMRIPYPMGGYSRGVDGRIDDPKAGWKGRGLWTTYAMVPVWHQEDGITEGAGPQLVHFQMRPDPLSQ